MELFDPPGKSHAAPLADRVRPADFSHFVGQRHLLEEGKPLSILLKSGRIGSVIFWGPPGVGKTTLAQIIAKQLSKPFRQLSAISSGVKDVRLVLEFAKRHPGTVLFLDEIHRFNKSQQDSLLGAVERGLINLIGATTENPSFEVNPALLSRCQVYHLEPLSENDTKILLENAVRVDKELSRREIEIRETSAIYKLAAGDARKSLALLEILADSVKSDPLVVTNEAISKIAQERIAIYDKSGEMHYDLVSAFIKSIRGGDPNAAVYWLARMLEGGEDVKFIARRLVILASEDIGNANPNGLVLASAGFDAVHKIGLPEARIILSQVTMYLATSPKSNAAYLAINEATEIVREMPDFPVPLHLRNAPTRLMKEMGYGKDYKYSHEYTGETDHQEFLPSELKGRSFYRPLEAGKESEIRKFILQMWGGKYQ